ncbi:HNH endonuclease [Photobacterium damselae]|uniref:HNH endonuclease n=1 Tax=Photobacterium damselae TaxID=38293 RepID=UPI0030B8FB5B
MIFPLVDGGADTVENCAATCPNCHRMLHFGKGREAEASKLLTSIREKESG